MGSPTTEPERGGDESQHLVSLSHGFWMGQMEVTRAQWERVMGRRQRHPEKPNPFATGDPQWPVVAVSYQDIQVYLGRLRELAPGQRFRLPTEGEWEYACRAGTTTAFPGGAGLDATQANIDARFPYGQGSPGGALERPAPVGSYPPNAWGLYDLQGNVWEWTSDWYGPYPAEPVVDPRGPAHGTRKVIRGGSWAFSAGSARSASRYQHAPGDWGYSLGFRVVWVPGPHAEVTPKNGRRGPRPGQLPG
jgi:formylglycine-generating enzyme required for sulfatase activity